MTSESVNFFKKMSLVLLEQSNKELCPLIRQWIEIIYTENKGYMMIWRDLASSLSTLLDKKDYSLSFEVYELIATLTQRYTEELKSYQLFEEIIDCMKNFCLKMTNDANIIIQHITNNETNLNDVSNNEVYMRILKNIINIAYNFNYQDFPEFFEDNLESWIKILYNTCNLVTKPIANVNTKSAIEVNHYSLRMLNLYISMYFDDIKDYADAFQDPIWNLFNSINVSNFLNEKITIEILDYYKLMFMNKKNNINEEKINIILIKLIFPNLILTDKEIEDFEENEVGFMKSEIEEIEDQTNKSNAINLLKLINSQYDGLYTQIVKPYYSQLLQNYATDPKSNWKNKIAAINMIFSTIINTFSTQYGVSNMKISSEELSLLMKEIVIEELSSNIDSNKIIKIFSFKFLVYFRNQIPEDWYSHILELILNILKINTPLYISASLLTLEKFLFMKSTENFKKDRYENCVNDNFVSLINGLYPLIKVYNHQAMICFYKTISLTKDENLVKFLTNIQDIVVDIFSLIVSLKSEQLNTEFNYQFFETVALLLKKFYLLDKQKYEVFRDEINKILLVVLNNNISDLINYLFQIYGQELTLDHNFTDLQKTLFNHVIDVSKWTVETKHLFLAFIDYWKICFSTISDKIYSDDLINNILLIVFKLCDLKKEKLSFELLSSLINFYKIDQLKSMIAVSIPKLCEIQNNLEADKSKIFRDFRRNFLIFLAKLTSRFDFENIYAVLDGVKENFTFNLFFSLITSILDIEEFMYKKLVIQQYCVIISKYGGILGVDLCKSYVLQIIITLEQFYKMANYITSQKEKVEADDVYVSASLTAFKLKNLDIPVSLNLNIFLKGL